MSDFVVQGRTFFVASNAGLLSNERDPKTLEIVDLGHGGAYAKCAAVSVARQVFAPFLS